ncbi:MAG TPA: GNAT family N-acetyltransferase [Thermoanaerobaculia bacterium]|nr:GNAT family N-acetyltransferase [Thermoanaerobaculia bacterium]
MDIEITHDRARMDVTRIHDYLSNESYWARGIPRERVERAIAHSLCFGAFDGAQQVGFARVISDFATFAYVADVFVVESHRGRGVSKQIMRAITEHPDLQNLRRWHLVTRDAHGLYAQFGFTPVDAPERHMMKLRPASPVPPAST